jgi:hypothetical protein
MTVVPHPCEATKFIWELLFPVGNHAAERARTRDRWPPLRERSPPELRSVPSREIELPRCERPKKSNRSLLGWPAQRSRALVLEHDGSPDIVYVS